MENFESNQATVLFCAENADISERCILLTLRMLDDMTPLSGPSSVDCRSMTLSSGRKLWGYIRGRELTTVAFSGSLAVIHIAETTKENKGNLLVFLALFYFCLLYFVLFSVLVLKIILF